MVLRKGHCKLRASACHPSRSVGLVPAFGRYRGADLILPISGFAVVTSEPCLRPSRKGDGRCSLYALISFRNLSAAGAASLQRYENNRDGFHYRAAFWECLFLGE